MGKKLSVPDSITVPKAKILKKNKRPGCLFDTPEYSGTAAARYLYRPSAWKTHLITKGRTETFVSAADMAGRTISDCRKVITNSYDYELSMSKFGCAPEQDCSSYIPRASSFVEALAEAEAQPLRSDSTKWSSNIWLVKHIVTTNQISFYHFVPTKFSGCTLAVLTRTSRRM